MRQGSLTKEQQATARGLRKQGLTLREIAELLHVSEYLISKIHDLPELTPEQFRAIRRSVWEQTLATVPPRQRVAKPIKWEEKNQAIELRQLGISIPQIAAQLRVSKSSVSGWVRSVPLSTEQKRALLQRGGKGLGNLTVETRARKLRLQSQNAGRLRNTNRWVIGCTLYWAEGGKSKNQLSFSNTDLNMLKFFVSFLVEELCLPLDRIKVGINAYLGNGLTTEDILTYWVTQLGLPTENFSPPIVDNPPTSSSGKKKGKHPYGCIQLRVNSTDAVQQIFGGIQEIFGFENPAWLA